MQQVSAAQPIETPSLLRAYALALLLLVAANALAFSPAPIELRAIGLLVAFTLLPGWVVVRLALRSSSSLTGLEQGLMAVGVGFAVTMLIGLVLTAPLRQIDPWMITAAGNATVLVLLGLAARSRLDVGRSVEVPSWAFLAVTVLAGLLRLTDLGWSELQGDEARVLLRAMAALQGQSDALIAHRKVPGEILLALVQYGQLGAMTEYAGRIPFALAAVAGVAAFYVLAREMLGERAAFVAGLLMAVNGYSVAFGRILQYESVGFLLGTLGLLCCLRFGRGDQPSRGLAVLGSLLLFGAGIISLGAMFFVLPAVLLIAPRLTSGNHDRRTLLLLWTWPVLLAVLSGVVVVSLELITQRAGGVLSYLLPRLGGQRPYWNGGLFLTSANHYLSTPYLGLLLGGGAISVLLVLVQRLREPRLRGAALAVTLALLAGAVSWQRPVTALAVGAAILAIVVATTRHQSITWRAAFIWAVVPLLTHLFLIRVPGTHWREVFPGLALLVAWLLTTRLPRRFPTPLVPALAGVFSLGVAHYAWVGFVQRWPEYQMTFPSTRHPLDWTGSNGRGIGGVFGASHRHGWKALAALQDNGGMSHSYATNESPAIAAWYLRRPQGCPQPPELVIRVPRAPQDRNLTGPVPLPNGYATSVQITVAGRPTVNLTAPPSGLPRATLRAEDWDSAFDSAMTSPWRPVGQLYQPDLGAAAARLSCQPGP